MRLFVKGKLQGLLRLSVPIKDPRVQTLGVFVYTRVYVSMYLK